MDSGLETLKAVSKASSFNQWVFEVIEPYVGERILDVGSGIGTFTRFLLDKDKLTCLDLSEKCIRSLRERFSHERNLSVLFGDICDLESFWNQELYDTVICLNVLEHIEDDRKAIRNMAQVLKENGRLILLVPAYRQLFGSLDKSLGHYRRYEPPDLQRILKVGSLRLEKQMHMNLLGVAGWFLNSRLFLRRRLPPKQLMTYNYAVPLAKRIEERLPFDAGLSLIAILRKTKDALIFDPEKELPA